MLREGFSSFQFSCSAVSDFLRLHGLQHVRLPSPSLTPGAYSNSHPSSVWWHPTISSSVIPFSSCLQHFPASESFPKSQLFTSGGQSIRVSSSASVLSMNIQDWHFFFFTIDRFIPSQSKGLSRVFSNTTVQNHQFFGTQLYSPLSHPYMTTGKNIALTRWTFVGKVMSLLFNMLSKLVTTFLPKSKCLLISWCSHDLQWFWRPRK